MSRAVDNSDRARAWYQSAVGTAAVAGAFGLIVCALLVYTFAKMRSTDLKDSDQLNALKQQLFKRPSDRQLQEQIRRLDLQLRQDYFRRRGIAATGAWLLLGGAAVFLIGAKAAAGLRKRPPAPQAAPDDPRQQLRAAAVARWSVAGAGVVIALGIAAAAWKISTPLADLLHPETGLPSAEQIRQNWPRFRGPWGAGISAHLNVPMSWNGKSGEGILWKAPVPLPGVSSPVVWAGAVFLTGATASQREVYCFDGASGRLRWRRQVSPPGSGPEVPHVEEADGYAASTTVTDGRRLYAIFANGDLACFDLEGKQLWARSLGVPDNNYGHASSLASYRNLLLIQLDQGRDPSEGKSELIALHGPTGSVVWIARRDVPNSWATPMAIETARGAQIVTCGAPWVIAYDPESGEEIWRAECLSGDVVPSPTFAAGLVFAVNIGAKLAAIRPDGRGDVTKSHITWTVEQDLPDICSPLCDGGRLYLLDPGGLLSCYAANDGKKLWEHAFQEPFRSSPSVAGGRVYLTSREGLTYVIAAGDHYQLIATAELGEGCDASLGFADGRIYIRGKKHLFCAGKPE